jgi:transposase
VESCRRLGLPVKDYLSAVLPGMSRRKHSEAAHLTPAHWKASHAHSG